MQSYSYNFCSTGMVLTNTWIIASSHNPKQLINESDLFIEDDIYELSDDHDLSIYDCINGIIEFVLHYLDLNWSGEYGLESDDMTDEEKVIELTKENGDDDPCWVKYFG